MIEKYGNRMGHSREMGGRGGGRVLLYVDSVVASVVVPSAGAAGSFA